MADDHVHPRPQLVRDSWTDLSGVWGFAHDDADLGVRERWYAGDPAPFTREIVVPFPPESPASGIGDRGFHAVVWYRRRVAAPDRADGERVLLHFGAVDHAARVWVNGVFVGGHEGGHTPFAFDVTDHLVDGEQTVVVRAEDDPHDVTLPRGKQDWRAEPHEIWYHRTTGVWQPVWLEVVPDLHVADLVLTPDVDAALLTLDVTLSHRADVDVHARVALGEEEVAVTTVRATGSTVRLVVHLAAMVGQDRRRFLWSPEHPVLLDVEVTAGADRVRSYAGMRSAAFRNGRFELNHAPYFLRMVLGQNWWPESHLAAPSAGALRREVELIKSLGFTGVRVHQKVEDPRFLHWCDRLGLLVWGEAPNAFAFTADASARFVREWQEVVRRDRSHPCVVTWVPLNESWGTDQMERVAAQAHFAQALRHLTKALDPTRPALGNDGWELVDTDAWTVHDYAPHGAYLAARYGPDALPETLRSGRPGGRRLVLGGEPKPVVISEFGGLSHTPAAGQDWHGYATVATAEEFLERFTGLVTALLDAPGVVGFCWTQLTDTLQENNGLLTADRTPKLDPADVREVLRRPAASVETEAISYDRSVRDRSARRR